MAYSKKYISEGFAMPPNNSKAPKKGYGKRPLWQWILLYVIIGAIVYAAIYLIFFHHGGSGGSNPYSY